MDRAFNRWKQRLASAEFELEGNIADPNTNFLFVHMLPGSECSSILICIFNSKKSYFQSIRPFLEIKSGTFYFFSSLPHIHSHIWLEASSLMRN